MCTKSRTVLAQDTQNELDCAQPDKLALKDIYKDSENLFCGLFTLTETLRDPKSLGVLGYQLFDYLICSKNHSGFPSRGPSG